MEYLRSHAIAFAAGALSMVAVHLYSKLLMARGEKGRVG
jgi:hypothetical protein